MKLTGTLYNAGEPLAGVSLYFTATETTKGGLLEKSEYQTSTDEDGSYNIDLQPGTYQVYWSNDGYKTALGKITSSDNAELSIPQALDLANYPVESNPPVLRAADSDKLDGHDASYFATSEQGEKADSAIQPDSLADVATNGSYDSLSDKPDLSTKLDTNIKGSPGGLASLDDTGVIPTGQLPSYVDDVIEVDELPETGESGKIYVVPINDTANIYRWSGSKWVDISPGAGTADSAVKLATSRKIALTGDASGSTTFDGSSDVSLTVNVETFGGKTPDQYATAKQGALAQTAVQGEGTSIVRTTVSDYQQLSSTDGATLYVMPEE
ncbi:carboxypeptidase regulatory-like domain-containing protein [Kushneria phosphatilytica]|uniref:Carboxypeptidase-like regulatory domain-containing protein n=1 Tax=Kushneria phosphatilytica TaxID=657387 RepID=A0A1S1NS86_9GAMM|nr:carboxypeptidase regulatory-like domain-containing protein [Kushneria phosphatilytica]OHV12109.1 hypothetical protein BH688_05510 [Kushneria phosphatilytica]QEL11305.1 carboxypeptidase-like regulatory domain-containing protein [Kushneria phosphatilytica]